MEQLVSLLNLTPSKASKPGTLPSKAQPQEGQEIFQNSLDEAVHAIDMHGKAPALINAKAVIVSRQNREQVAEEKELRDIKNIKDIKDIVRLSSEKKLNLKSLTIEIKQEGSEDKKVVIRREKPSDKIPETTKALSETKPQEKGNQPSATPPKIDLKELIGKMETAKNDTPLSPAKEKEAQTPNHPSIKTETEQIKAEKTETPKTEKLPSAEATDRVALKKSAGHSLKPEIAQTAVSGDASTPESKTETIRVARNEKPGLAPAVNDTPHSKTSQTPQKTETIQQTRPNSEIRAESKEAGRPEKQTVNPSPDTHETATKEENRPLHRAEKPEKPVQSRQTVVAVNTPEPENGTKPATRQESLATRRETVTHKADTRTETITDNSTTEKSKERETKLPRADEARQHKTPSRRYTQKTDSDTPVNHHESSLKKSEEPRKGSVSKPSAPTHSTRSRQPVSLPQAEPLSQRPAAPAADAAPITETKNRTGPKTTDLAHLLNSKKPQKETTGKETKQAETEQSEIKHPAAPKPLRETTPAAEPTQESVSRMPKQEAAAVRSPGMPLFNKEVTAQKPTATPETNEAEPREQALSKPSPTDKAKPAPVTLQKEQLVKPTATLNSLLAAQKAESKPSKKVSDAKSVSETKPTHETRALQPQPAPIASAESLPDASRELLSRIVSQNLSTPAASAVKPDPVQAEMIQQAKTGMETALESVSQKEGGADEVAQDAAKADDVKTETVKNRVASAKATINHFVNDMKEKIENYRAPLMKLTLDLNPKNLGSVGVTLLNRGKNLHVQIHSNSQAIQLFMQNHGDFRNALGDLGYKDVQLNFSSGQGSSANHNGGGSQGGHQPEQESRYYGSDNENGNEAEEMEIILPDLVYG